jgi:uncharacterized Zn finger protein (UPF0148 family)
MPSPVSLRCSSCGATLILSGTQGRLSCPYCGGSYNLDDQESHSGRAIDVASVIAQAQAADSESQFRSALWTLASIRGAAAMAYLNAASTTADELRANIAVEALKQAYTQETSIPALVTGLRSSHPLVRAKVAELLQGRSKWLAGNAEVAAALMASLADPIYNVRMLCVVALGDVGGDGAVPALVRAWKVAASDPFFPAAGYAEGGAPQFLVMEQVEAALRKLVPNQADRMIREVEQEEGLSEMARSWIDYRRSPSSRNYRKLLRQVR